MRVSAAAFAVPERIQTADQLAPMIGKSAQWIVEHTGVRNRRVADSHTTPADLAAAAARQVISLQGPPDLILYAGSLPQQIVPDTSVFVHQQLGLISTPSFSINQTCLSFLSALQVADSLIKTSAYRKVLICSAELATRGRRFDDAESAALLGDGAAAVMVEPATDGQSGLLACGLETWSSGADLCSVRVGIHPSPIDNPPDASAFQFQMQGLAIYRFIRPKLLRFIDQFLKDAGYTADQMHCLIPHQASGPAMRILLQAGFDEQQLVSVIADYGNCVAASIPMALAIAVQQGRIHRGDLVMLIGTAAGASIGAAILRW